MATGTRGVSRVLLVVQPLGPPLSPADVEDAFGAHEYQVQATIGGTWYVSLAALGYQPDRQLIDDAHRYARLLGARADVKIVLPVVAHRICDAPRGGLHAYWFLPVREENAAAAAGVLVAAVPHASVFQSRDVQTRAPILVVHAWAEDAAGLASVGRVVRDRLGAAIVPLPDPAVAVGLDRLRATPAPGAQREDPEVERRVSAILAAFADAPGGVLGPGDLVTRFSIQLRTLQRDFRRLSRDGLIAGRRGRYRLTAAGQQRLRPRAGEPEAA